MADDSADNQDKQLPEESTVVSTETTNRQTGSGLLGTVLLVLFLAALLIWIRFTPSPQKPAEVQPPSPSKEEEAQATNQKKVVDNMSARQIDDALNNFLKSNYKDWQERGKSANNDIPGDEHLQAFDIQLIKSDKNQVITVFIEKFQKDDGSEYWFAYQPSSTQQLESTIRSIEKKSDADSSNDDNAADSNASNSDTSDDDN